MSLTVSPDVRYCNPLAKANNPRQLCRINQKVTMNIITPVLHAESKKQLPAVRTAWAAVLVLLWLSALPAAVQAQFNYSGYKGTIVITGYYGTNSDVDIPTSIEGLPVRSIGSGAFLNNNVVVNVTIPGTVTNLGKCAFQDCSALVSVTIPGSVACIQTIAFDRCGSLARVTISNGVTSIAEDAFTSCSSLTNVVFPASISNIGDYAFENCYSLASITLPSGLTSIGKYAFAFSGLTSVTIPPGVTNLGGSAFYGTSLTTVAIPGSVTSLQNQTFSHCYSLTNATMPNGISSIGDFAFYECYNLARAMIPASVTNIGQCAFLSCQRLKTVYFQGDAPTTGPGVFVGDANANAYYLPGTTNWGSTFCDIPAVLWNPQPQHICLQTNQLGFTITGTANIPILVEACANLASPTWTSLQSCTLTNGSIYFNDSQWTNYPARFYRIRSP